ncbi:RnfH family protein [Halomonas sp. E14]|uniref:RnfH family protein n=1 Tax=Halomonas sp. E14 TaxID=3397245 RepID=UPI00403EF30C
MAAEEGRVRVEVAFALPDRQEVVMLEVPVGTTARQAVDRAGLPTRFSELPAETFASADLGLFGKLLRDPEGQRLRDGDRVEVYRPLLIDPKAARARRAGQG